MDDLEKARFLSAIQKHQGTSGLDRNDIITVLCDEFELNLSSMSSFLEQCVKEGLIDLGLDAGDSRYGLSYKGTLWLQKTETIDGNSSTGEKDKSYISWFIWIAMVVSIAVIVVLTLLIFS